MPYKDIEKVREKNRNSYWKYKKQRDLQIKNYQLKAKEDVISHYSNCENKCKCCGVSGNIFLTVDHIDGKGGFQRKNKIHKTGSMFYIWLRSNKYPKGFQILCHNCNQAKGQSRYCPHKELLSPNQI